MAAVFPPPPPDPYKGINGLNAAWARWVQWLMVDLPRQWDELRALLSLVGTPAPPSGGGGEPPPPPPLDFVRHYPIPEGFHLSDLSEKDQQTVLQWVSTWPDAYAQGVVIQVNSGDLSRLPSPIGVALALLGWTANPRIGGTRLTPWGAPENPINGDRFWYPGLQYRW